MSADTYRQGRLVERADDTARTVTRWDDAGTLIETRPYTAPENAEADTRAAEQAVRAKREANTTAVSAATATGRELMTAATPSAARTVLEISAGGAAVSPPPAGPAQLFGSKLYRNTGNVNLLVLGDSTMAGNNWPLLLATSLAEDWPAYTVQYRSWVDSGPFAATQTVSTGTGPNTLLISNVSSPGWGFAHFQGSVFTNAILPTNPDLVLVGIHHNDVMPDTNIGHSLFRGRYFGLSEAIAAEFPGATIVAVTANPKQSTTDMSHKANQIERFASQCGYGFIDIHHAWLKAGSPAGWFADTVHPNATGSAASEAVVREALTYRHGATPAPRPAPALSVTATNYCTDGNFAGYASGTPTGWVAGNTTFSKDVTNYDSPKAFGVRVLGGAANAQMSWPAPTGTLAALKGKHVSVAVRLRAAAIGQNTARVMIADNTNSALTDGVASTATGSFFWVVIAGFKVSSTASSLNVYVYPGASPGDLTVDRVILVKGDMPRDSLT